MIEAIKLLKNSKINMKNQILIDIDTSRDKIVQIKKMESFVPPTNQEEAKKMILEDVSCTFEGLCTLIHIADQNGYGKKEDLVRICVENLTHMISEIKKDDQTL